jgi:heme-degrading monooxygenase HmoA
MTVTAVLRLVPRPGYEAALERLFESANVFDHARQSGGLVAARLLRPRVASASFLVISEWESSEDYEAWLQSSAREAIGDELRSIIEGEPAPADLFEDASPASQQLTSG